ncbi:UNVERIFIED_CONTAM: hypothetical protein K2H54_065684 [Gekko kuhli]
MGGEHGDNHRALLNEGEETEMRKPSGMEGWRLTSSWHCTSLLLLEHGGVIRPEGFVLQPGRVCKHTPSCRKAAAATQSHCSHWVWPESRGLAGLRLLAGAPPGQLHAKRWVLLGAVGQEKCGPKQLPQECLGGMESA